MESEARVAKSAVLGAVAAAVRRMMPGEAQAADVEGVSALCAMALVPTGEEDPRAICSGLSDRVVTFFVSRMDELSSNPTVGPIAKILMIEWLWRNDFLLEDWIWEWTGESSGTARFNERVPLSQIPLPRP
jgi:hypothetical protein